MMGARYSDILTNAHCHATAQVLADTLARHIAQTLGQAVHERGRASLVVSGGRTPVPLFEALSQHELPWEAISITLADERWVASDASDSNEQLVRTHLLRGPAAGARLVGLYTGADTPGAGMVDCSRALAELPRPFDVVVLGMGDDGHTASLFPGSPELDSALDEPRDCAAVTGDKAPRERMTLTPTALLDSRQIILHIAGDTKWQVLEAAVTPGPITQYPVRSVLHQARVPLQVHWSP